MFRKDHKRLTIWPVLSGLVFLAVWSNTVAWVFCPHMTGSSAPCFSQHSSTEPHKTTNARLSHQHSTDMQMSDMDMQAMPMDMSAMTHEAEKKTECAAPEARDLLNSEALSLRSIAEISCAAFAEPNENCSHCMMHSQSSVNLPSRAIVVNSSHDQGAAAGSSVPVVAALVSLHPFFDVHDHGPPGLNGSRYILLSTFRI